jgi:hypothetical protein
MGLSAYPGGLLAQSYPQFLWSVANSQGLHVIGVNFSGFYQINDLSHSAVE